MRSIRVLVAALLATVVLVAAGCGSETNDYRGDVSKVQEKYLPEMQKHATEASTKISSDPAAAGTALDSLGATATQLADDVAAIDPPDDKQQLADQLVGAYRALATASTDLKAALVGSDIEKLNAALQEFNDAQAQESTAVNAFNAAD